MLVQMKYLDHLGKKVYFLKKLLMIHDHHIQQVKQQVIILQVRGSILINYTIIRTNCSNNFGPYQFPEKLIPIVILKALDGLTIPIYGKGDNIRDWLYVEDHIDALILVIEKGTIGKNYCIGGNNEKTNLEIAKTICFWLDSKLPKESPYHKQIKFVIDRPGHDQRYGINSNLIQEELGWAPKHSFDSAIKKTIFWYLDNREWCDRVSHNANYFGKRIGILKSIIK